jgi:hypothetical protein
MKIRRWHHRGFTHTLGCQQRQIGFPGRVGIEKNSSYGQNTVPKHRERNTSGLRAPWPKGVSGNPAAARRSDPCPVGRHRVSTLPDAVPSGT